MALRIVQVAAGGRVYTGQPIAQTTAVAVAEQVAAAIRDAGATTNRLITFGETDGFEHTVLRVSAITGLELLRVTDPDLDLPGGPQ